MEKMKGGPMLPDRPLVIQWLEKELQAKLQRPRAMCGRRV